MARLLGLLKNALHKYPLASNSIIYGTLYVAAEFSQQTFTKKVMPETPRPYDFAQIARFGLLGVCYYGPCLSTWYKWLDKKFVGTAPKTIATKMLLDQLVLTPPMLGLFFIIMSVLEGKKDLLEECRDKVIPTYQKSCVFWLPAQALNFLIVPPTYRVVYVATCAFVWVNILCYVKRQDIRETKEE